MPADRVAPAAGNSLERRLEGRILERLDLPAVVADEMVVMLSIRVRGLEARDTVPEVDPLHEVKVGEAFESPIDARNADASGPSTEPVVDLLRRDTALLACEELDDRAPSASTSPTRRAEPRQRVLGPDPGHSR